MIILTGGAGFIGSNLLAALNARGERDIIVVDNLGQADKCGNLARCEIADYYDKHEFFDYLKDARLPVAAEVRAIFHQGACTVTTERDGSYMMRNNYTWSRALLELALARHIPFYYASSAAVYGTGRDSRPLSANECPITVYGYSKLLFDQYVRRRLGQVQEHAPVVGLRYFNVYGPGEHHKGAMASMALQLYRQRLDSDTVCLFEGSGDYPDGEQRRDFVHVSDVVKANLWLLDSGPASGVFNVGTGVGRSFNDLARAVNRAFGGGKIAYIPFPEGLRKHYQSYTQADISALRSAGYAEEFVCMEDGVKEYIRWLRQS